MFGNTKNEFVSPGGFEPPTISLRGSCSTSELWARELNFTLSSLVNSNKLKKNPIRSKISDLWKDWGDVIF